MTKPNAVEEMMGKQIAESVWADTESADTFEIAQARSVLAAIDAAGLAIIPHDWNHREEDWSLQSVSEWLER